MEAYFDAMGPAGRRMMCNTAAVQVNLGLGPGADDATRQWRVAHAVGPTLAAAFANSPLLDGGPSGFRSTRLATWWAMDPSRTRPVDGHGPGPDAWAAYALAARVMLVRVDPRRFVPLTSALSFERWIAEGHELGWPTVDDLHYHLSTLFPPVRPKGWLELRMVDALPDPWWRVPVAVTHALLADGEAGEAAVRAAVASGAAGRWVDAACTALAHPGLAASARACFAAAQAALGRLGVGPPLADAVAAYVERWVDRGRTPADDRLDAWAEGRSSLPEPEEATSWT
jgi:glutamate--cysteine ligase